MINPYTKFYEKHNSLPQNENNSGRKNNFSLKDLLRNEPGKFNLHPQNTGYLGNEFKKNIFQSQNTKIYLSNFFFITFLILK